MYTSALLLIAFIASACGQFEQAAQNQADLVVPTAVSTRASVMHFLLEVEDYLDAVQSVDSLVLDIVIEELESLEAVSQISGTSQETQRIQELLEAVKDVRKEYRKLETKTENYISALESIRDNMEAAKDIIQDGMGCTITSSDPQCFTVMDNRKKWNKARQECQIRGEDLAVALTQEQMDTLNALAGSSSNYWLGARQNEDGEYAWAPVDNEPLLSDGYENWRTAGSYPSVSRYPCVSTLHGQWIDTVCTGTLYYICQRID